MEVILYSTGCPRCKVLTQKLNQKGVNYIINESVEEMEALGIQEVPVLSVGGDVMDFSEAIRWINNL